MYQDANDQLQDEKTREDEPGKQIQHIHRRAFGDWLLPHARRRLQRWHHTRPLHSNYVT